MTAFDLDFPLRSALARRAWWEVSPAELIHAATTEHDRRRQSYPAQVARGRRTRADADRSIAAWAAIADDLRRDQLRNRLTGQPPATAPAWTGSWTDRVAELRRELAVARDVLPRAVDSPGNPMTAAGAAATLERLDALLHRYWVDLTDFSGPAVHLRDDHARVAWIAAAEHRAADHPDRNRWFALGRLADCCRTGAADGVDLSHADSLARWTIARSDALLATPGDDQAQTHRAYVWTVQVDAWLLARRLPHA